MAVTVRITSTQATYTETLYILDCASCGVVFAVTADFDTHRRSDGNRFYCPNGHYLVYNDHELGKLRKEVNQLKDQKTWLNSRLDQERAAAEHERRRAAAARGQLTKMRNRVANGCCPASGCKRSFTNIVEHVRTEHPELLDAIGD